MPNRDLKFRLFGEDISASSTISKLGDLSEKMVRKVPAGLAATRNVATGIGLAAGASVLAVGSAALKGAADAEQANLKMAGSLGLTAKQASRFGKLAGDVYASNYGESMEQVQGTIGDVVTGIKGMRSASDRDVKAMTSNVLSFASAFEMDASEAVQQVNQLMASKLAKDGPAALDLLTAAMQKVPKAVRGDLMDAVNEYAPFMHQLGLSGEQGMELLVKSTGKGMYGLDKTGDALKEFTIRSTDMSKSSVSAYKTLGLNAHTMSNDILKGGKHASGAMDTIVERLLKIKDPAERSNTAIALFGTQMEDLGVGEVPKFLRGLLAAHKGMGDTAGSADKLAKTTGGGASNSVAAFSRKWEVLTQKLTAGALPIITKVFDFLGQHEGLMKVLVVGLGIVAVAVGVLTAAMWALSLTPVALMIGGIVLAVGLLIAGIVLLVTHWKDVCGFLQDVWGGICKWFGDTLTSIGKWWSDTWTGISDFFQKWGGVILAVIAPFLGIPLLIIRNWDKIAAFFSTIGEKVIGFLAGAGKWLVDTGSKLLSGLIDGAKDGLLAFGRWQLSIGRSVIGWLSGAGKWLVDTGSDLLSGLIDGAKDGLLAFGRWELSIGKAVIGWLSGAGKWLVDTGADALRGLLGGAKDGARTVRAWFGGLKKSALTWIGNAGKWLVDTGGDIVDGLVSGIRDSATNVISAARDMANLLPEWVRKVLDIHSPSRVFRAIGKFVVDGLIQGLTGSQDQVKSAMATLTEKVKSAFDGLADQREASQKRLRKLDAQLGDVDQTTKAGRKRAAAIRQQIADERTTLRQINATAKIGKSSLLRQLESEQAALSTLAKQRDRLAARLEKAQETLATATGIRDDYAKNVAAAALDGANIAAAFSNASQDIVDAADRMDALQGNLDALDSSIADAGNDRVGLTDKIAAAQQKRQDALDAIASANSAAKLKAATSAQQAADNQLTTLTRQLREFDQKVADYGTDRAELSSKLAVAQRTAAESPIDRMLGNLRAQVDSTREFGQLLVSLKAKGLDDTSYSQLVGDGVEKSLDQARMLDGAGGDAITTMAALQGQLKAAADKLGRQTSKVLYQTGVDEAQAHVDGLKSQITAVTGAIGVIQQQVATSVGKLGVDTSALMRSAGGDIADALKEGLESRSEALKDVLKDLSKTAAAAVEKGLKLDQPAKAAKGAKGKAKTAKKQTSKPVNKAGSGKKTATPGKGADGTTAGKASPKALVHIEHMHTTPNQSPSDIAADLGWLARGGL